MSLATQVTNQKKPVTSTPIQVAPVAPTTPKKDTATDPEDAARVKEWRAAGLSDEQIATGLIKRKQVLASGGYSADGTPSTPTDQTDTTDQGSANPFAGKTKQEVLSLAFQSGIHDSSTLTDIGKTYDLVTGGGEKTAEQKKQDDYQKAQQFISDNPKATREELSSHILQYTNLQPADINSLFDKSGIMKKSDIHPLTDENLQSIADSLVKTNTGFFTDSKKGLQAAQAQADNGVININKKEVRLSPDQIAKLKQYMQQDYPGGRTLMQKILPWGK